MTVSFFTILCNCLSSIGYMVFSSVFIDEIFFDYVLFRFSHFCKSTGQGIDTLKFASEK